MKRTWSDVYNENNGKFALLVGGIIGGVLMLVGSVAESTRGKAYPDKVASSKLVIGVLGGVLIAFSIFGLYVLKCGRKKTDKTTYDTLLSCRIYSRIIKFCQQMSEKIRDKDEKDQFIKHGDIISVIFNNYLSKLLATPVPLKMPNTNKVIYAAAIANALAGPAVGIAAGISEASKVTKQQIAYEQNKKDILEHKITVDNYQQVLTENYNAMLVIISHYKDLTDMWNEVVQEEKRKMNKEYRLSMF